MPWMPLMLNLQGCRCLIAGGGKTAMRKAKDLLAAEAVVTVVALEPDPSFGALPVTVHRHLVKAEDLSGMALVVDATGDDRTGRMLARLCRERNLFFNCAADPEQGTALFPAVLRTGQLTAGISTLGASPAAAAWVRDQLAGILPARLDEILQQMTALRQQAKARIPVQEKRARFLHRCLDRALELGRPMNPEELAPLWALEETSHDETT